MPSRRTITVHHARAVLRGAQRRGFDALPLLQRAGIPPLLLRDDSARVTPEQFTALVRAVYTATDDEFLGLGAAPSKPGTFAMMCCAALGCEDLGAATERAFLFYGLFPSGPRLALERQGPGGIRTPGTARPCASSATTCPATRTASSHSAWSSSGTGCRAG